MTGTWSEHRDAYAASETTWRKSVAERMTDWATGCGWCSKPFADHPLSQVITDHIMGRLTDQQYSLLVAAAALQPDSVESIHSGGQP